MDATFLVIWLVVPMLVLGGRAAMAAYRTKKKRDEVRRVEERVTPITRKL